MKKTFKKTIGIIAIAAFSIACSKDDPAPVPEPVALAPLQNPFTGFLTATGFNQNTLEYINAGDYEFGYSFIPLVNGKMTAIVAKIPDTHLAMRVTIWDKVAGIVLRSETIDITTAGVEVTKTISALDLVKDKEYFITFNSNDWYDHRRTDSSSATYPFTVGDIKITSYAYHAGATQSLPNTTQTVYYAGDCSFKFQK